MDLKLISSILTNSSVTNFISGTIGNIIGAFVGFGLALILQKYLDKRNRDHITQKFKDSIDEELNDIARSLVEYVKLKQVPNCKICIPSWDAIIYSGIILELIKNPIYPKVIKVYSSIKRFNESLSDMSEEEQFKEINEIIQHINVYFLN